LDILKLVISFADNTVFLNEVG